VKRRRPARAKVSLEPSAVGELPLPRSGIRVCYALPPRRAGRISLAGWWPSFGAGLTLGEARRRARAEAIERASGVFRGDEPRIRASYRELGEAAVHPAACLLFSERQRRAAGSASRSPLTRVPRAFDEDARIDWSPLWSLTHRTWKYLPSMCLYFKYPAPPAGRFGSADSNGIAASRHRPEAALHALLELVERDSVALWWYNRVRRPAFDLDDCRDPELRRLLACYHDLDRQTWVLDLTSDLEIPVCAAISRRHTGRADLAFGFGAGLEPAAAVRHALCEMAQMLAARAAGGRGGAGTAAFERWRRGTRAVQTPHLLPSDAPRRRLATPGPTPRNAATAVSRCRAALEARGLEVLSLDLTRPDAPLAVIRMVVPGLRHLWPRFAPGRLYDAPVAAGWRRRALSQARLNPVPLLL